MPALQSVVLTDRATTPVNHTLVPMGNPSNGVAVVAKGDGTLVGEKKLSISTRRVNGKVKTRLLLALPVVQTETINGVSTPKVVRESWADCTFTFSTTSSEQERKDTVGMFMSALDPSKVLVNDTLVKAESIW
nr:MAG: putative coat protein [Hangzhou fiers-like virus 2]